jgi:hypothetical protein
MKEAVSLRLQPDANGSASDSGPEKLLSMPTSVLYRGEAGMLTRPGAPHVLQRANRPGQPSIARSDTPDVLGSANRLAALHIARRNTFHPL